MATNYPSVHLSVSSNAPVRTKHFPAIATLVLVALNVLIFVLVLEAGGLTKVDVLLDFGASYAPYFRSGEYWRLVTPMFLHLGWAHLAGNMLVLCLLGVFLEPLYGYGRFSLIYVAAGMGGSLLSMEASPYIGAGASGAIFGIAGAMLVTGLAHPEVVPWRWKTVFGSGAALLIAVNLIYGRFSGHADNWAHLGGLATGIVMALLIPPPQRTASARSAAQPLVAVPVAIVLVGFGAAFHHAQKTREVTRLLQDSAALQAAGKTGRARALLDQARQLEPRDARVREAWGLVYLADRKYDQAIQELAAALRVDPFQTLAALGLAAAYEGKGDFSRARDVLDQFNRHASGNVSVLEALAEVCSRLKLYPEAIERYEEALRIAPNSAVMQNNLAWLYATCDDQRYRDSRKAVDHAMRAVLLTHSRQPGILDTLAAAFYANGQFELAARAEARAVELDPQNAGFRENLMRYQMLVGKQR